MKQKNNLALVAALWIFILCGSNACADTNPKKLPAIAIALHAARTVYLVEYPLEGGDDRKTFVLFYNALQAAGRFQLVPTRQQADVVFKGAIAGKYTGYSVTVVDPHTLATIGTFTSTNGILPLASNRKKAVAKLVKQAGVLGGAAPTGGRFKSATSRPAAPCKHGRSSHARRPAPGSNSFSGAEQQYQSNRKAPSGAG